MRWMHAEYLTSFPFAVYIDLTYSRTYITGDVYYNVWTIYRCQNMLIIESAGVMLAGCVCQSKLNFPAAAFFFFAITLLSWG